MFYRALVLLFFVLAVYLTAFVLLIDLVATRLRKDSVVGGKPTRWARRISFSLAALGPAFFAYGLWVEPYWPVVTTVELMTTKLPPGSRPIKLVHISDLHSDPEARLEDHLPGLIGELEPDLIVFTGDALNAPGGLPNFRRCMTALAKRAPTFAVRGNWDVWYWSALDLYGGTGVRLLDGEAARVEVDGAELWVAGAAVDHEAHIAKALSIPPEEALTIFLHHYPERITQAVPHGADLMCAGDTNGGQIRLPLLGALIRMSRFGAYYDVGPHTVGAATLNVNQGIGMEGGEVPRVRFLCRPEITLIEIAPSRH